MVHMLTTQGALKTIECDQTPLTTIGVSFWYTPSASGTSSTGKTKRKGAREKKEPLVHSLKYDEVPVGLVAKFGGGANMSW